MLVGSFKKFKNSNSNFDLAHVRLKKEVIQSKLKAFEKEMLTILAKMNVTLA